MKMKTLSYLLIPVLGLAASVSLAATPTGPQFPNQQMTLTLTNQASCPFTFKSPGDGGGNTKCKIANSSMPNGIAGNGGTATISCPPNSSLDLWYNNVAGAHTSTLQFNHIVTSKYSYFMQSYDWGANLNYSVNGTILNGSSSLILSDDGAGNPSVIKNTNSIIVVYTGTNQEKCGLGHSS